MYMYVSSLLHYNQYDLLDSALILTYSGTVAPHVLNTPSECNVLNATPLVKVQGRLGSAP